MQSSCRTRLSTTAWRNEARFPYSNIPVIRVVVCKETPRRSDRSAVPPASRSGWKLGMVLFFVQMGRVCELLRWTDRAMPVAINEDWGSGNSEALRLPRDVAYGEGVELVIVRSGNVMTICPADLSIPSMIEAPGDLGRAPWAIERRDVEELPGPGRALSHGVPVSTPTSRFICAMATLRSTGKVAALQDAVLMSVVTQVRAARRRRLSRSANVSKPLPPASIPCSPRSRRSPSTMRPPPLMARSLRMPAIHAASCSIA